MSVLTRSLVVGLVLLASTAHGQEPAPTPEPQPVPVPPPSTIVEPTPPTPAPEPETPPAVFEVPSVDVHGFVSQGALVTNHNDYLGHSKRGSLEFTEAAVNFSTEPVERLRVGAQLFTRDLGAVGDYKMTLDWAYIDYRHNPWLGFRAGRVKLPFGLYNEYSDVDSARLPILLPQGIYPILSRDVLLAQTGFEIYGSPSLGALGGLDYRLYYGTWFIDPDIGAGGGSPYTIVSVDTERVAGFQVFVRPPIENLRVGASLVYSIIHFNLSVAGPMGDIKFVASLDPVYLWVASAEYIYDDWQFSAEYSRWIQEIKSSPELIPSSRTDSERAYAMVTRRLKDDLEVGAYYSLHFADVNDREGTNVKYGDFHERAWQKDLAATVRYDVNDSWLWKLEGHFMDGAADLTAGDNPFPKRYWLLFLIKTTVSF